VLTSLLRILGVVAVGYVVVCVLVWRYQDRLAFPSPRMRLPEPSELRVANAERVTVVTGDGVRLHGWYLQPRPLPEAGQRTGGLVWFYGNMETVAGLAPILEYLRHPAIGMIILDYRGYGESDSSLTEEGLYRDAEAAWDYLAARPDIDPGRIAVYGRSVGAVPALHLGTTKPVRAVILDSPFTSVREMADLHYSFIPRFLLRLSMDNLERAERLAAPLLAFHGTEDRIAPFPMGERVARAGRGELVRLEGAGHNDTYDAAADVYRERMWRFLAEHLQIREEGRGKREE
jgi:fermentation-respiration switch protein FrsA (DUF1100 family)